MDTSPQADALPDFDRKNWPLPDEFLLELGRLAALWTRLEAQVNIYIGKLAGFDAMNDMRPLILIHHTSFRQKLDMLSSLCEQLVSEYPRLEDYRDVVSEIGRVQTLRNRYAHNGIGVSEDGKRVEILVMSARGKLKTSFEQVSSKDIKQVSIDISYAMSHLHRLVTGHDRPPFSEREV